MSKLSKEERIKYDRALKRYRDMYNTITGAEAKGEAKGRAEGLVEGRAEGLVEGRAEERMANAMSLKANGVPIDIIAKSLGLTEDEVARL